MPISEDDIIRCAVRLRNPFRVTRLPLLSRVYRSAYRQRRRVSKRFIGKPAKQLFRLMLRLGMGGEGEAVYATPGGPRRIAFNARNTQFGALFMPQCLPLYEPETSALLDRLVGDGDCLLDVGANWGWYALFVASRPGFSGRIHAFEPFPSTFDDLQSLVRQAGMETVITCHRLALSEAAGEAAMGLPDGVQSGLARFGQGAGPTVALARLDDLDLPDPTVMKIDAEEHEAAVIRGAVGMIDRARPFMVFENWLHPDRAEATLAPIRLLASRQYRLFYPGWIAGNPDCVKTGDAPVGDGPPVLVIIPFLEVQRFQLPEQLNILAVPSERLADLKKRLG